MPRIGGMWRRRLKLLLLCAAPVGAGAAQADLEAELADLGARAEFGFYAREPAVVEAARAALEQLSAADGRVTYHRALAALRAAQLQPHAAKARTPALAACIDSAERAAELESTWAEPWILVAACSALAAHAEPVKTLLHARRFDQALARARAIDSGNPRVALAEAWRVARDHAELDSAAAAVLIPRLEAAAAAYAARSRAYIAPDWGEAETLAWLCALHLRRGDVRAARDFIEQALIAAPGFAHALELKRQVEAQVLGAAR